MTHRALHRYARNHPAVFSSLWLAASLALAAIVILFSWNSFATAVLDLGPLQFREALGLTLLLAVAGRLLSGRTRHAAHRHRDQSPEQGS